MRGHTHVILIGHSGGGPTTSYFQALAENGPSYCQGPNKLTECPFTGAEFVPADRAAGIVYVDAHPGIGINQLRSLNASVVNEDKPFGPPLNRTLDAFDPQHGYNSTGGLGLLAAFCRHLRSGAVETHERSDSRRSANQAKMELGLHDPAVDAFVIARASARLVQLSTGVQCCTLNPTKLLRDTIGALSAPQIIRTVRVPQPEIKEDDDTDTEDFTITSFLSANAIRSNHSLDEENIDWCSTNNSTPCAVANISVPTLVMAMQGHYFIRDGEYIYESSASIDKQFVVVEGATHGLGNCNECAAFHQTGPYTNVPLNLWNYVRDWANARF